MISYNWIKEFYDIRFSWRAYIIDCVKVWIVVNRHFNSMSCLISVTDFTSEQQKLKGKRTLNYFLFSIWKTILFSKLLYLCNRMEEIYDRICNITLTETTSFEIKVFHIFKNIINTRPVSTKKHVLIYATNTMRITCISYCVWANLWEPNKLESI